MNAVASLLVDSEGQYAIQLLSGLVSLAVIVGFWSFVGRWAYRDAQARGRSGGMVALLVILFFPLGWILWLALRPPVVPITLATARFSSGPMMPKPPV